MTTTETRPPETAVSGAAKGAQVDPRMLPAAKRPEVVEKVIAASFLLALLALAGFGAAYWEHAKSIYMGAAFSIALFFLGFGMAAWGKYLMPRGPFEEERHPLTSTPEERDAFKAAVMERGRVAIARRTMLVKLMGAASAVFGVVAMFPLLRSLGPVPGNKLAKTAWRKGSHVVSSDGTPVHVDDLEVGGVLTVFPANALGNEEAVAMAQTMLIRVALHDVVTKPGRETWGPQGYLAYSKVCTHAGCPVGLYEEQSQQLLCPCHQSLFDILTGADPVFGPAPRPLPQLPLYVDSAGYLRAQAPYDQPVGPGYWTRPPT